MPVSIDEVSADISTPAGPAEQSGGPGPTQQPASEMAEQRKYRESLQQLDQRARRVMAD